MNFYSKKKIIYQQQTAWYIDILLPLHEIQIGIQDPLSMPLLEQQIYDSHSHLKHCQVQIRLSLLWEMALPSYSAWVQVLHREGTPENEKLA